MYFQGLCGVTTRIRSSLNVCICRGLTSNKIPPSIRAESTLVYSTIGKSLELRCSAIVPFDTKLYWQRLDNATLSASSKQQEHTPNDLTQISLYLTDIESHDFGFYGCFAESIAGENHAIVELREHHRSSTSQLIETHELTTSRIQILKRNKVSDQTTMALKINSAPGVYCSLFNLSFISIQMILFCNLT